MRRPVRERYVPSRVDSCPCKPRRTGPGLVTANTPLPQPPPPPPCLACGLVPPLCPASVPARCLTCRQVFAPGVVGYPEAQAEPAETWTPPDWPVEAGVCDDDGHPLTWGRVAAAHASRRLRAAGGRLRVRRRGRAAGLPLPLAPRGHRVSRSAIHTSSSAAPGPAPSAAPAGRPVASAATCSTPSLTRTRGGLTAACAATPLRRVRARSVARRRASRPRFGAGWTARGR